MKSGIRIDKFLNNIDEVLTLVPNMLSKINTEDFHSDTYVKLWKFYEENNNPETIRSAGILLSESFEFKRNEGYLGLVLFRETYSEEYLPEVFERIEGINNLTPRGISTVFSRDKDLEIHFNIFVANGKSAGALVKSILLTRAFELEVLLEKYPLICSALYSGIFIKSKKVTKCESILLENSHKKPEKNAFLNFLIPNSSNQPLTHFSSYFCNKEPSKLYMNPYGITFHKPKVSSLSLKNVQSKLQEKQIITEISDISKLNELEMRDTTRNEINLEYYNEKLSEIYPGLYVGGEKVAKNKEILKEHGITHIINCAGNVCENYFEGDFKYQKYYIKDSSGYNIECLFYPIFSWVKKALKSKGKVLVHCMQGVSRSVAICIGYIIFQKRITYDLALEEAKNIRNICSPNIGFQVQLIWWYKRLCKDFAAIPLDPRVFVICSYDVDDKNKVVARLLMRDEFILLDERSVFIVVNQNEGWIWVGKKISQKNSEKYLRTAKNHCEFLEKYENCKAVRVVKCGEEEEMFWKMWREKVNVGVNDLWEKWFEEIDEDLEESKENLEEIESFSENYERDDGKIQEIHEKREVFSEELKNDAKEIIAEAVSVKDLKAESKKFEKNENLRELENSRNANSSASGFKENSVGSNSKEFYVIDERREREAIMSENNESSEGLSHNYEEDEILSVDKNEKIEINSSRPEIEEYED